MHVIARTATVGLLVLLLFPTAAYPQASKLNRAVRTADNLEPSIPRTQQEREVAQKLAERRRAAGKRPNIVWIVVDDMGYGDPGCYGGGKAVGADTPVMDRLAREGLRLTCCYSQHTCTPTRSAILTGRLPVRTGLIRPILAGDKLTANPWDGETSVAKILSDAGYYSLLTGKWHIGEGEGMRPHEVGFDEYYGYLPAQKEITQALDIRRYPDLKLDAEKYDRYESIGAEHALIHGYKDGGVES